jgi:hypothetical protein
MYNKFKSGAHAAQINPANYGANPFRKHWWRREYEASGWVVFSQVN